MDTAERRVVATFRSDMRPVTAFFLLAGSGFGLFVLCASLFFAWRSGKPPDWGAIAIDTLLVPGLFAATWVLCLALRALYPVRILAGALRCYDMKGAFATVPWHQIRKTGRWERYGFAYVTFRIEGRMSPITVPLWLEDMPGFVRELEKQAGKDHVLVKAFKSELGMA